MRQAVAAFLLMLCTTPAIAQQAGGSAPDSGSVSNDVVAALPFAIDGPPPPVAPATIARDEQGRVTVRAVKLSAPLRLDGRLDEEFYTTSLPSSDFIQNEPVHNVAATEKTEVWVAFDDDNIYVSMRAAESRPDRMVVNEMRRDALQQITNNESFAFMFDTFYDRRNSVMFHVNPIGGRIDGQITNESNYNGDWNPVWSVEVQRGPEGWTLEAAVPFKSLRYRPGRSQIWGFGARRINRWKNEASYLTPYPPGYGQRGPNFASRYATLVGLEVPDGGHTVDIKPYAISDLTTDHTTVPRINNDVGGDAGVDAKIGVTQNLTADLTYRTDFAQVEADEQQVNLTRFSLFFPEKREFFLENQGLFQFGNGGGFGGGSAEVPTIFYSRRIGLDNGLAVPIIGGGRLSGRAGAFSIGFLSIQTDDEDGLQTAGSNFTVARLRRDVFSRSSIGALFTRRSTLASGSGSGETYGLDGNFAFGELALRSYWSRTRNTGLHGDDHSYRAQLDYNGDRYGLQVERLHIGDNFAPEVGFVRRDDIRKNYALGRFSPRPARWKAVRKFRYEGEFAYIENGAGVLETRQRRGEFGIEFQNSDQFEVSYDDGLEAFDVPFRIAPGVIIPAGSYRLGTLRAAWTAGQQRRASGTWFVEDGAFYDGDRTAVGYTGARIKFPPHLAVEPGVSINWVTLPYGDFTTKLVSARTTYTMTPMMFVSGLVQYNSTNQLLGVNLRFRWEYQPGSELFVVYNEGRDTTRPGYPDIQNRAFVIKVNRLFRL